MWASEGVSEAQDGDGLVPVLEDLEALLGVEVEALVDAVLCSEADVGAAAVN